MEATQIWKDFVFLQKWCIAEQGRCTSSRKVSHEKLATLLECNRTNNAAETMPPPPPCHKTITAAAMMTNRITSLQELLHYRRTEPKGKAFPLKKNISWVPTFLLSCSSSRMQCNIWWNFIVSCSIPVGITFLFVFSNTGQCKVILY